MERLVFDVWQRGRYSRSTWLAAPREVRRYFLRRRRAGAMMWLAQVEVGGTWWSFRPDRPQPQG